MYVILIIKKKQKKNKQNLKIQRNHEKAIMKSQEIFRIIISTITSNFNLFETPNLRTKLIHENLRII